MPPKRRAASGASGRATRQKTETVEVEKSPATTAGRGRSAKRAPETPTKATKGRKESMSPAPAKGRGKKDESPASTRPTRGRSAAKSVADEPETSKPRGRSSKRGQSQDVGAGDLPSTPSKSSHSKSKSTTPKLTPEKTTPKNTPKTSPKVTKILPEGSPQDASPKTRKGGHLSTPSTPKVEASVVAEKATAVTTPKGRRGKTPTTPKNTPKATKSTPKSTPKATKTTPKAAKTTPKSTPKATKTTPKSTPKATKTTPKSTPKATKTTPKTTPRRGRGEKVEDETAIEQEEVTSPRARGRGKKAATPQATSPSPRSRRGRGAKAEPAETPAESVEAKEEKEVPTPIANKDEDIAAEQTPVAEDTPMEEANDESLKRKRDEEGDGSIEEEASSKRPKEDVPAKEEKEEEVSMETAAPESEVQAAVVPDEAPVSENEPVVIEKSDTPEPVVIEKSDTPEPVVIEKSDTPEPVVIEKSDTQEPGVIEKSETPEPVVIEKSDTPEPVVIEKSDTPEVQNEPEVIAEVSPVKGVPEVPVMELPDSPVIEQTKEQDNDVVELQESPKEKVKEVSDSPVEIIDDSVVPEKETNDVIEEISEKKNDIVDDVVECIEDVVEDNVSGKETPEVVSEVMPNVPIIEDVSEASSDVPVIEHEVPAPADVEDIPDSTENKKTEADELKEYVVVDLKDVPDAESAEVTESLPQHVAPPSEIPTEAAEIQPEPVAMETTQEHTSHHSDNTVNGVNHTNNINDPLLSRKFIPNPHLSPDIDTSQKFTVVSYNILADFHIRSNPEAHSYLPEEYLSQEYRHARMMAELQYLDADVICLQEVGKTYYSQLEEDLRRHGYLGVFKCRTDDTHPEGEATFYRSSRFTLVDCTTSVIRELAYKELESSGLAMHVQVAVRKFLNHPDVLVVTKLRCNITGKVVTVGNVHVAWTQFKLRNLQCIQISHSIKKVVEVAGGADNPHIICGDFNSQPDSPGYQLACDGYLNDATMNALQALKHVEMPDGSQAALINLWWKGFMHTSPNLKSAYALAQDCEPEVTCYDGTKDCLDYILSHPEQLHLVGVLKCVDGDYFIKHGRLPTNIFPSDHLAMKAVYAFL